MKKVIEKQTHIQMAALYICRFALFLCIIIFLVSSSAKFAVAGQGDWFVAQTGDNTNDCQSSITPCATIEAVIAKGSFVPGDTIFVDNGYYIKSPGANLIIKKDVILSGGWNSTFTNQVGYTDIGGGQSGLEIEQGVTATISQFSVLGMEHDAAILNYGSLRLDKARAESYGGQGVYNLGNARLQNSRFDGSLGMGILNSGVMSMTNISVSGHNTTGIGNSGVMTITHSIIRKQFGWWGCRGIGNGYSGKLTVIDSAIIQNTSIYPGIGGGICNYGNATLINSTVSGNNTRGEGGGIYNAGQLFLFNSTISHNSGSIGGGIYITSTGQVTAENTILAANWALAKNDCSGEIHSLGYNLIETTNQCKIISSEGDLLNVNAQIFPTTNNYAYSPLGRGSSAINNGDPMGCMDQWQIIIATDQRGVLRSGRCDIGAYEYDPAHDILNYIFFPQIFR